MRFLSPGNNDCVRIASYGVEATRLSNSVLTALRACLLE